MSTVNLATKITDGVHWAFSVKGDPADVTLSVTVEIRERRHIILVPGIFSSTQRVVYRLGTDPPETERRTTITRSRNPITGELRAVNPLAATAIVISADEEVVRSMGTRALTSGWADLRFASTLLYPEGWEGSGIIPAANFDVRRVFDEQVQPRGEWEVSEAQFRLQVQAQGHSEAIDAVVAYGIRTVNVESGVESVEFKETIVSLPAGPGSVLSEWTGWDQNSYSAPSEGSILSLVGPANRGSVGNGVADDSRMMGGRFWKRGFLAYQWRDGKPVVYAVESILGSFPGCVASEQEPRSYSGSQSFDSEGRLVREFSDDFMEHALAVPSDVFHPTALFSHGVQGVNSADLNYDLLSICGARPVEWRVLSGTTARFEASWSCEGETILDQINYELSAEVETSAITAEATAWIDARAGIAAADMAVLGLSGLVETSLDQDLDFAVPSVEWLPEHELEYHRIEGSISYIYFLNAASPVAVSTQWTIKRKTVFLETGEVQMDEIVQEVVFPAGVDEVIGEPILMKSEPGRMQSLSRTAVPLTTEGVSNSLQVSVVRPSRE
jgi:hypothetical protein